MSQDRTYLLQDTPTNTQPDPTPQQILVTTFHPSFKGLRPIVDQNWGILGSSHKTIFMHDRRLIAGLRKPKSTRDLLVKARTDYHPPLTDPVTSSNPSTTRTYNLCRTRDCRYCQRLDTTGRIISKVTSRTYNTKINVSCKSSNVIYAIECQRCKHQYVGQTERKLMSRMCEHFAKITHSKLDTDMGRHFCTPPHQGLEDVKIYILDFISCHPQSHAAEELRDKLESDWIHNLRCIAPQGLNIRDTPRYRKRRNTV